MIHVSAEMTNKVSIFKDNEWVAVQGIMCHWKPSSYILEACMINFQDIAVVSPYVIFRYTISVHFTLIFLAFLLNDICGLIAETLQPLNKNDRRNLNFLTSVFTGKYF